jgi:hypothetical protein
MNLESPEKIWGFFYFQSTDSGLSLDFPLLECELAFFYILKNPVKKRVYYLIKIK